MRRLFHWIGALALTALLPSTALAQNDETTTLEVGYMPILPVAQLFVMEGAGWTDEAGLDLELTRFSSGPAMVQALASGKLDVMNFGIGPAMGRVLAALVMGDAPGHDLGRFRADRFSDGSAIRLGPTL